MNKLTQQEYYDSLHKRPMGAGALIFNTNNEILIVKPNYKDGWLYPGGTVESGEFPSETAVRETKEEIGLDIAMKQLLCVDCIIPKDGAAPANVQFIFYGGILDNAQVKKIVLQSEELDEFCFVSVEKAIELLRPNLARRLPHCLEALKNSDPIYLENGETI